MAISHVETVRDIDFYLGEFDHDLLGKVYFGTPYEQFRKKIMDTHSLDLPAAYWFDLDPSLTQNKFEFDYLQYPDLKIGSVIFKVLTALTFDFYKKQNMYTLFELVFPSDYLNLDSSFNKVHQALKRTRDWLKKQKIPLEITERNEEYFLQGNVAIKIYLNDRVKDHFEKKEEHLHFEYNLLKAHFENDFFTISEAMIVLQYNNLRKAQRLMKKGIEKNLIRKARKGRSFIYYF